MSSASWVLGKVKLRKPGRTQSRRAHHTARNTGLPVGWRTVRTVGQPVTKQCFRGFPSAGCKFEGRRGSFSNCCTSLKNGSGEPQKLSKIAPPSALRAQRLKNFKTLKFSSEIGHFKRAAHQTPPVDPHPLNLGGAISPLKFWGWSVRNPLFYSVFWGPPPKFRRWNWHPLNLGGMGWQGLFVCGEFWRSGLKFQARLNFSSGIEIFNRDLRSPWRATEYKNPSSLEIRKKYEKITKSPISGLAPKIRKKYRKITKLARKWPFL